MYPDTIRRKYEALRATGLNKYQSALTLGMKPKTCYRWEEKEQTKNNIEQLAQEYISNLPTAIRVSERILEAGSELEIKPENVKILDLAAKEAENVRKAVGISPTHTQSVVINNLVIGSQTVIDPRVSSLLGSQLGQIDEIDVTPIEVDSPPIE